MRRHAARRSAPLIWVAASAAMIGSGASPAIMQTAASPAMIRAAAAPALISAAASPALISAAASPAARAPAAAPALHRGGLAPPAGAGAKLMGTPYSRPVEVPAAGWVRVPLDLAALRHVGLYSSLRVTAPNGEETQHMTAPLIADSERRPVKVLDVRKAEHGWTLRLDAGSEPLVHERLLLDFARLATAPDVALDSSQDGESWEPLVAGDLFRLGDGQGLARTYLLYPATSARYLRLAWPAEAGFPELRGVQVEAITPGRSLTVTSPGNPCRSGASAANLACRLPLPAAGRTVRRLTVELAGGANIGYRLYQPRNRTWQALAGGVWRGARAARHVVPLPFEPLAGDSLRLELYAAAGDPPPRLLGHSFDLAIDTVLFYAETPGRYTMSYGGVPSAAPDAGRLDARPATAGVDAAWVPPGPEEETRQPALPAVAAPGAGLSARRFRVSWLVTAAGAAAGDLVRLALPEAVYGQARPDLGDLRLAVADRQIPYVRWTPPEPVPVLERADLRPEAEKGRRYSRIEVSLPAAALPVTELQLTAPAAPLRRPVGVRYPDPGPPSLAPREERLVAKETWECLPEPPLPCRLALPLAGPPASGRVAVRFADGDNSPLATVDMSVWRRGDVLLFAWPGEGRVQLLAGAPGLSAPVYDLATLAEVLPSRPWQRAEIDLTGGLRQGAPPGWSRWVLPVTLGVACLFLLLLLRRILAEHEG